MVEVGGAAKIYRQRAMQLRGEAHAVNDEETKKSLLCIAENYEQLARLVEKTARKTPGGNSN